jgi:Flp pilus assembly protein TadG
MLRKWKKQCRCFWLQEWGASAVEFALLLPALTAILFGIIDFGDLFMRDHLITNASREGARYGVAYRVDANNNRILPSSQTTQITNVVNNYLTGRLPSGSWLNPTISYDSGTRRLTITVIANKSWFGPLGFFLENPFPITAATVMIAE